MITDKPDSLHGVSVAAITTAMRELGMVSAVAAQWGQASDPVRILYASGDVERSGSQVADYCHRAWDAANDLDADGVVNVFWDDEARCWSAEIEDRDDASRTVRAKALYRVVVTTDDGDRYWDGDVLVRDARHAPAWDLEDAGQQSGKASLRFWDDDTVEKETRLELA